MADAKGRRFHQPDGLGTMRSFVSAGAILLLCVTSAGAQGGGPSPDASTNATPQVALGDHWIYQQKDEISGAIKETRTFLVTDISNHEIAVRVDVAGATRPAGNIVYDPSWNIVRNGQFKYSPNDGTGVQFPLKVGAQWKFAIDVINSTTGITFRRNGNSRVTGQESITTKAGTFETFVIETIFTGKSKQDPTLLNQTTERTWFSLDIDHWVRRNFVHSQNGHLMQNDTIELISSGHKE